MFCVYDLVGHNLHLRAILKSVYYEAKVDCLHSKVNYTDCTIWVSEFKLIMVVIESWKRYRLDWKREVPPHLNFCYS